MKLNESPVRTARNFNINNIKIENFELPDEINNFSNVEIIKGSSKVDILENSNKEKLFFGLNENLENQVNEYSNKNLKILINSKTDNVTILNFRLDKENPKLVENIEIVSEENTEASIILKYESDNDFECYHNGILKFKLAKNSKLNVILVNLMNYNSNNFLAIDNELQENSKLNFTIVDFGGKNSITNYYSNVIGDNADNNLKAMYIGKENQLIDLNYITHLRGKKSNVDIEVQGALKDNAKKHFKGTIDFKNGCKKATGNENENCMLLSDKAKSIALPMLLCSEEDVEGNHSTSAGKIGEKELFYIMSRGIDLKEAQKLLVKANFNKILKNIKNKEIKNQILYEIDQRLD